MTDLASLRRALDVLDARIKVLELKLKHEMSLKKQLRRNQVMIAQQEQELIGSLHEVATADPRKFAFLDLRLRKLVNDQRELLPVLASAAIDRHNVQDTLKRILQQRLVLSLQIEKLEKRKPIFQTEAERTLVLFELGKRR